MSRKPNPLAAKCKIYEARIDQLMKSGKHWMDEYEKAHTKHRNFINRLALLLKGGRYNAEDEYEIEHEVRRLLLDHSYGNSHRDILQKFIDAKTRNPHENELI